MSVLDFHYLVCRPGLVERFSEHHELGLFTAEEYVLALQHSGLDASYDPPGVFSRGLFLGIRPD